MTFIIRNLILITLIVSILNRGEGTTLPETYPANLTESSAFEMDLELEKWLDSHVLKSSLIEQTDESFYSTIETFGLNKQLVLLIKRKKVFPKLKDELNSKINLVRKKIEESKDGKDGITFDPFYVIAMEEQINGSQEIGILDEEVVSLKNQIITSPIASCGQEKLILDSLETPKNLKDIEFVKRIITNNFKSSSIRFQKQLIRKLNAGYEQKIPIAIQELLFSYLANSIELNTWLADVLQLSAASKSMQKKSWSDEVIDLVAKNDAISCKKAVATLNKRFEKTPDINLKQAAELAESVEICVRRFDSKNREKFWTVLQAPFAKYYGDEGDAEIQLELSYFYWDRDLFEMAIKSSLDTIAKSKSRFPMIEANATYALGLIYENQKDFANAQMQLETFIEKFPSHKDYTEALRRLVLINSEKGDWNSAIRWSDQITAHQDQFSSAERSESILGFALFWQARSLIALGKKEDAKVVLERLIKEIYSTYYSAMGHYLLEEISGKIYAVEPTLVPEFRIDNYDKHFSIEEQSILKRIDGLLRVGLQSEALCELGLLDFSNQNNLDGIVFNNRKIRQIMVLHAAGNWFQAIKLYNEIPRDMRSTLPRGFEKIVFPKRYQDYVQKFASQSSVDPYLIFALIRQESIFNPEATSSAGARGVMQLMHKTAIQVSRSLQKSTAPELEFKKKLHSVKQDARLLYNPEVNISLGAEYLRYLIDRYEKPIFVLASYNAGEGRLMKWIKDSPPTDMLLFIERIPFQETRNYVKLILRNYFYYQRLYQDNPSKSSELEFLSQISLEERPL